MTKVQYGIMLPTGELARVRSQDTDADFSNPTTHELTDDKECPVYLVDDPTDVAEVLVYETPDYNSTLTKPSWGGFLRNHLKPAKVEMVITVNPDEIVIPALFEVHSIFDMTLEEVRPYTNKPVPQPVKGRYLGLAIVQGKAQDLAKSEGQDVYFGEDNLRTVIAVEPIPETHKEYQYLQKQWQKSGVKKVNWHASFVICESGEPV